MGQVARTRSRRISCGTRSKRLKYTEDSENDILIVLLAEYVLRSSPSGVFVVTITLLLVLDTFSLLGSRISLFLARHLLQSVEFLPVEFVELGVDVFDGVLGTGDEDMLAALECQ